MKLDLHKIIEVPGASLPFECELLPETVMFPYIQEYITPPTARGAVRNMAGALMLEGGITARMIQVCDRCLELFEAEKTIALSVPLADSPIDIESPDVFPLEGDELDLTGVLEAVYVLETDLKSLCREDCRGLCPDCGANLNDGACSCGKKIDPRLAVLGQLLDMEDN